MKCKQLKPYKSYLFCKSNTDTAIKNVLADIQGILKEGLEIESQKIESSNELDIGFIIYTDKTSPSWCSDGSIQDIENHLLLIVKKGTCLAIYSSDGAIRDKVRKAIVSPKSEIDKVFKYLTLIPQGVLNSAFIKGQAQTLWLSGTHKRTASKVDNKIITGMDLQYALDPLGDQSYFFTAARCKPTKDSKPVGVSPRKSTLWLGISKDWSDFIESTEFLIDTIEKSKNTKDNPLPVLATSINSIDGLANIGQCYDIAFIPQELLVGIDVDPNLRELAEKWSLASFELMSAHTGLSFTTELFLPEQDKAIGKFTFTFELQNNLPRVDWSVEGEMICSDNELFDEALSIFEKHKAWIKIWYDSGHIIADREIFLPRYRDLPFLDYIEQDLSGYEIKKEKPPFPLEENIGKYKSLFCYTQHHVQTGWLTCDDGSMEIADFIHFDDQDRNNPLLQLIHVKASKTIDSQRSVSVSDYEIVVSQAVKNIRYLSYNNICEGLIEGLTKKVNGATWKDGEKVKGRENMIESIKKHGGNINFKVVVFQPRACMSQIKKSRKDKKGQAYKRLQQLDTLLLGARQSCQSVGADFEVWVDI